MAGWLHPSHCSQWERIDMGTKLTSLQTQIPPVIQNSMRGVMDWSFCALSGHCAATQRRTCSTPIAAYPWHTPCSGEKSADRSFSLCLCLCLFCWQCVSFNSCKSKRSIMCLYCFYHQLFPEFKNAALFSSLFFPEINFM